MRFLLDIDPEKVPQPLVAAAQMTSYLLTGVLLKLQRTSFGPITSGALSLTINGVEVRMRLEP